MSSHVTRAAMRVAEALFHDGERPPPADRLAWLEVELADFTQRAGPRARLLFRAALFALWWIAPLFAWTMPTFGRLPVARRIRVLERADRSALLSAPFLAVKAILCILYYEHPDVAREIHFDGHASFVAEVPGHPKPVAIKRRPPRVEVL